MNVIDQDQIENLKNLAKHDPRQRSHLLLHESHQDRVQRIIIALTDESYFHPHLHPQPNKWEQIFLLEGEIGFVVFDEDGNETKRLVLSKQNGTVSVEILPNTYHTLFAISKMAVILEIKEGPFKPEDPITFANWAPGEGSEESKQYLKRIRR